MSSHLLEMSVGGTLRRSEEINTSVMRDAAIDDSVPATYPTLRDEMKLYDESHAIKIPFHRLLETVYVLW